jgi:serine/threonine protein kinase
MKGFFARLFGGEPTPGDVQKPSPPVASPHSQQRSPELFKVGDTIRARWDVHRVMQGGMGIVYVVYDRKWREAFAAKTFQQSVFAASPVIKTRFENEATAWVNLDLHPNIAEARFLDVIDGQPFLFLEYVAGGDLSAWIGTPRLINDLPQVLRFGIQFCDGMQHIASKGIKAHRDIKPQNCLVTQDAVLKITDFGLAKVWDDAGEVIAKLGAARNVNLGMSQTGSAAGTCTHMAPEQFLDSKHVDVRADIYSFGVMLFQMVCGELPFIGRTFEEFGALHIRNAPPMQRIASQRVRKVIERCLQKKAEERYSSFRDLRGDLASVYRAETGDRAPDAATGDILTAFHWVNKGKSLGDLKQSEDSLACFDKAISLNPTLAEAWLNKGATLSEIGKEADALSCFERALGLNPTLAVAWANKAHLLINLGRHREALPALQKASELNPADPAVWYRMGCALAQLEKHAEAVAAYQNVVRLDPQNKEAWFNMGHSFGFLGRHSDVVKCCDRVLEIDPRLSQGWILKGLAFCSMDRFHDAIPCFQEAEKLGDRSAASHIANCRMAHADWYFRLGSRYQQEGNHVQAVSCYEKGLAMDSSKTVIWLNTGAALLALERPSEAVGCFDRAIALNPRHSGAWNNKGIALLALGKRAEGLACIVEAKKLEKG